MSSNSDELSPQLLARLAADVGALEFSRGTKQKLRARLIQRVRSDQCGAQSSTIRGDDGGWRVVMPLVHMKVLRTDDRTVSFLLRLEAGAQVPAHEHETEEECMVLDGIVTIGELTLSAGDYHLAHQGIPHGVMSTREGATLFLRGHARPQHRQAQAA